MKTVLKLGLVLTMALGLTGCGVGVENDDAYTGQQEKDAQKLRENYAPAIGQYEGTFTSTDASVSPLRAKLSIYTLRIPDGTNPDGSPRIRVVLYGRFQMVDVVTNTDYTTMTGNYDKFGNLTMAATATSSTASSSTDGAQGSAKTTNPIAVSGTLISGTANLSIFTDGKAWGHFDGERTSSSEQAPSAGEDIEYANRLRALYRTIEGRYQGTIDNGSSRSKVEILITIAEGGTGGSTASIPYLIGQYRRLDFPDGIGERQLSINYNSVSGIVSMNNRSSDGTVPGSQTFSGNGTWKGGLLDVALSDRRGPLGTLVATRKPIHD